jgi:class 3 adenylate cyclase
MGSLVSLVMTDIVGSTRRWSAAEGAMAADLETHDRLVAEVVTAAGGRVFKHTGDGMIAVFDDPVAMVETMDSASVRAPTTASARRRARRRS